MVNSHYVPQFILRQFCNDNKIMYCDKAARTIECRNVKSVFAEKGYYSDQTEKDLCHQIEYDFSVLYHNKLEAPRNSVVLNEDEMFILKKYLIVSAIRYKYIFTESELEFIDGLGDSYKTDVDNSLKKVLQSKNMNDLFKLISMDNPVKTAQKILSGERLDDDNINMPLWADAKNILYSYVVFIKAPEKEKFIIPDRGRGIYEGPMSRRKLTALMEYCMTHPDPVMMKILFMIDPHDYTIYPLTKDIAILSMSTFFKMFTDSDIKANVKFLDDCPTVSAMLGFGSREDIAPPKVKIFRGKKEYRYKVNRLGTHDISFLNCLMMAQAQNHFAFSDLMDISKSIENISDYEEFEFLRKTIDYITEL